MNILNKLDMGLITEEELIENPDFIKNVINWFTFSSIPKKDVVLKLILRLTKVDICFNINFKEDGHFFINYQLRIYFILKF